MHKISTNHVDDFPFCSTVSNIGTTTYQTIKYLTKLLSSLGTSEYTIINTKTQKVKIGKVPLGYDMVSLL